MTDDKKTGWFQPGRGIYAGLLAVVLLLLGGCGEQRWEAREALDFSLPLLDGSESVTLKEYRGKVVYLTFWASWCIPCREEMPYLSQLWERHQAEGLQIIGINVDDSLPPALQFATDYKLPFPLVWDKGRVLSKAYHVPGFPTHYLVDRHGKIRYSGMGFNLNDVAAVAQELETLLAESADATD